VKDYAAPESGDAPHLVRSYGGGRIVVMNNEWREPLLVWARGMAPWRVGSAAEVAPENLGAVLALVPPPELLVLGCGRRGIALPPDRRAILKSRGLAVEVVDTGAACRLYNMLVAESRRVVAALVPTN